jgi:hypothetical protein
VTSNFTDITIRKYINYLEQELCIDKHHNSESSKFLIGLSCFQGPISFFLKKVMANFDFKSPFNMLDTPFIGSTAPGLRSPQLSEYLMNNGATSNLLNPLFCPRDRLVSLLYFAELKQSKLVIMTDPQGV